MKADDDNDLEETWRRIFDDAELPPPPDGWARVEADLPPARRWRPVFWWPLAAALLLLSGGLGWWVLMPPEASGLGQQARVGETKPERPATESQPDRRTAGANHPDGVPTRPSDRTAGRTPQLVPIRPDQSETAEVPEETTPVTASAQRPEKGSLLPATENQRAENRENRTALARQAEPMRRRAPRGTPEVLHLSQRLPETSALPNPTGSTPEAESLPGTPSPLSVAWVSELAGKRFQPYAFGGRLTLPPLAGTPAARRPPVVKTKEGPRFWLEGSAFVARFNPVAQTNRRVAVAAANHSSFVNYDRISGGYTNAAATDPGNAPALSYVSFGVDARGGMRLTRHWYLEGGLQFLRGHSTLTSDVLLVDRSTSGRTSLYSELLNNAAKQTQPSADLLNRQNVVVPARNLFRYSFDYGSVPVLLGYRIRPGQPVSYTLSAGLAGDVFLSNRLESLTDASIAPVRYVPSDGVYRRFALSGVVTAGMELKLSRRWALTARGLFRQALTPGVRGTGTVQIYPHTLGLGFGGQYRF